MLSDDLHNAAEAMRLSADAPTICLRGALRSYSDATSRAANRVAQLERIIARQRKVIGFKAAVRRAWTGITMLAVEGSR